jgi:hypothetical protein
LKAHAVVKTRKPSFTQTVNVGQREQIAMPVPKQYVQLVPLFNSVQLTRFLFVNHMEFGVDYPKTIVKQFTVVKNPTQESRNSLSPKTNGAKVSLRAISFLI